jgi:hypothetical protein
VLREERHDPGRPRLGRLLHHEVHPPALGHGLVQRHRHLHKARVEPLDDGNGAAILDAREGERAPGPDDLD